MEYAGAGLALRLPVCLIGDGVDRGGIADLFLAPRLDETPPALSDGGVSSVGQRGGSAQKPCASIFNGGLNLLRKFSMAIAAVNSTIWASLYCAARRANSASSTLCPGIVMRSAYSRATLSA